MQCRKCCKLSHNKKNIKRMFRLVHTAQHHDFKDCPHKNSTNKHACSNCSGSNNKTDCNTNNAFSRDCPNYIKKNIDSSQELMMAMTHHYDIRTAIPIR